MKKNKKHLTREQKYQIDALLQAKKSQKEIADIIGKDKSVISRELSRNSHKQGYSACFAQEYADLRKERFRGKRKFTQALKDQVIKKLTEEQWSPVQIAGKAKREGLPMVSHERIYQFIRQDKAQGGILYKHLRHRLNLSSTKAQFYRQFPIGYSSPSSLSTSEF
ncbi:hypothetical protein EZS27_042461 [termite gut metagenome]|uniref:Transposase IS30-like HTH domain-containing protein n=1 Tax=termite gut metagenome TaxID=433724 RepID=A0A5J4P8U2_9ZZZZ